MNREVSLYDKPECPFCWRVRMALQRCNVDYQHYRYDDPEHLQKWQRLSPGNTVPLLMIDEIVITESAVMLEYLNDRYGNLLPASARERALARELARYADAQVGEAVRKLVFERRQREPKEWDQGVIASAMEAWHQALPRLERALAETDYFVPAAGIPDYVLASRFGLAMAYGMAPPQTPLLGDWFARMADRSEFLDSAPSVVRDALRQGWQVFD
ncbi:MAG: glutathione S-transferase family protein [Candidatus Thiodiazotropha sp.]